MSLRSATMDGQVGDEVDGHTLSYKKELPGSQDFLKGAKRPSKSKARGPENCERKFMDPVRQGSLTFALQTIRLPNVQEVRLTLFRQPNSLGVMTEVFIK